MCTRCYLGLGFSYSPNSVCVVVVSGGSRPGIWGRSQIGGRGKVFTCLNTKGCLRQPLSVTQKWLPFVGQKVAVFVGRTRQFFR